MAYFKLFSTEQRKKNISNCIFDAASSVKSDLQTVLPIVALSTTAQAV
jgi:hypothetical protein